jgi:hypothetical protein
MSFSPRVFNQTAYTKEIITELSSHYMYPVGYYFIFSSISGCKAFSEDPGNGGRRK